MAKKLSTEEILKAARAQSGKTTAPEKPAAEASAEPQVESAPVEAAPVEEAPAPVAPKAAAPKAAAPKPAAPAAGGAPKSTKDILAAARAQATSGGAAPAAAGSEQPAAVEKPAKPAAAAAGGAPKSTKDILAAARAQTGAGAAAAAAKPPVAKAPAAKAPAQTVPAKAAAVAPVGNRPSVQEMLKAAREGKQAEGSTALVKPAEATLVIPQKPAPAPVMKAVVVPGEPRRGFLARLGVGLGACVWVLFGTPFRAAWTSFAGALGLWGLETARFMMPNVLVEPPSKFKVGPASDYPPAAVSTKWTAQYGVWIVHNEYKGKDIIYALQTVCTHLGCTPNWLEGERKFKCPCHGSGFYITGVNFEGPAPRPLERMAIRVAEDGSIEVDKSRKFQEELGQWADPASFVPVT